MPGQRSTWPGHEALLVALNSVLGDGLVPLASALGRHANPRLALAFDESRRRVAHGTNHLDLLSRSAVYAQIKQWLAA